ncbi:hypothetical protein OAO42_01665, partial [Candidatus Izimaplasma bacterium]|nr:hypothetical protein [Candidatus Izimaplasma bacterium]
NLVGPEARLTNFVLEHPPPFSRIARTAEKAVPIKGLADKADAFQQLLSVEGIEGYYNEAIYQYQQKYVGGTTSYEALFMAIVYDELTIEAKTELNDAYFDGFGEVLSPNNYFGVSLLLVEEFETDILLYEKLIELENDFNTSFKENLQIVSDYENEVDAYDIKVENYEYQLNLETYEDNLESYLILLNDYLSDKIEALKNGEDFTVVFDEERPELSDSPPVYYEVIDTTNPPVIPEYSQAIIDAEDYIDEYEDKEDVLDELQSLGTNFVNHEGLLRWYVEELNSNQDYDSSSGDISPVIVSFKDNYDDIMEKLNDQELEDKLYLAQMSIRSYDVFTLWLECTMVNMDTVPLDEIELPVNRCDEFDTSLITEYDFQGDALSLVKTLFEGESVSWIITQFKYDYDSGLFDEEFADFEEVLSVLESTKGLVDDYDAYYKDIANSIEGNISMLIKIGISVMKYNLDLYDTLENTPLISAFFNDAARLCNNEGPSPIDYEVDVCIKQGETTGIFGQIMNLEYLVGEVVFKAYIMVDEENERIIYDTEEMHDFLARANEASTNNVISAEVIEGMGDQFAFHVIDETNNYTLLEEMYDEGYITIEAMRVLADDEYELFSEEFRARVRSLIR